jgi:hypothetical protein
VRSGSGRSGFWIALGIAAVVATGVGTSVALTAKTPPPGPVQHSPVTPADVTGPADGGAPGSALALLASLPIRGKSPMTGYDRAAAFGPAWLDVDRNGCDTRNDILARDLTATLKSGTCRVTGGLLVSPYTGRSIRFVRGDTTSTAVQIDHVVSLANAWQTGAQHLSAAQRVALANDPINLFAVDGASNQQKGAGDSATWLPPAKSFRCTYVSHQVSVKAAYRLWVTQAEHDAMARVLGGCAGGATPTSRFAPGPDAVDPDPAPAPDTSPQPVVHPGSFCSDSGASGITISGARMVCSLRDGDARLRWRAA